MKKSAILVSTATVVTLLSTPLSTSAMTNSRSSDQQWLLSSAQSRQVSTFSQQTGILATDPKLQEWVRFEGLVRAWKKGRATSSSVEQIISAPEYLSIIGMGETAIPFLLSQLKQEGEDPDMWFWALASITGENPVSASDAGNFKKMAESWLEWGQQEGYAG